MCSHLSPPLPYKLDSMTSPWSNFTLAGVTFTIDDTGKIYREKENLLWEKGLTAQLDKHKTCNITFMSSV